MRRRLPWLLLIGLAVALAGGSQLAVDYDWPPDEDGITPIPLLRVPEAERVTFGPLAVAPVVMRDTTFRISFRWLGQAPSWAELEQQLRATAAEQLPGFTVQPRPPKSWVRTFRREPLVQAPGFEFSNVVMPVTPDLSPYETASTDSFDSKASGRWARGEENILLAHEMLVVDFHLAGADILTQLHQVDAFTVAFAEKTNGRIKSNERMRQATIDDFRGRRLNRWMNGVPFAPSYVALAEYRGPGTTRLLVTEGARVFALPELWLTIPDGVLSARAKNLLIGAAIQRLVESPQPDLPGIIDLDVHALHHPDLEGWTTMALPSNATGKLRLKASELKVRGGRVIRLEPDGDPIRSVCAFGGCELSASFGE